MKCNCSIDRKFFFFLCVCICMIIINIRKNINNDYLLTEVIITEQKYNEKQEEL